MFGSVDFTLIYISVVMLQALFRALIFPTQQHHGHQHTVVYFYYFSLTICVPLGGQGCVFSTLYSQLGAQ